MSEAIKDDGLVGLIHEFTRSGGPIYALWALLIIFGVPSFWKNLPQIIKSVGEWHDAHRKTSAKIAAEQQKLDRAMEGRQTKGRQKGGKNART